MFDIICINFMCKMTMKRVKYLKILFKTIVFLQCKVLGLTARNKANFDRGFRTKNSHLAL